MAEQNNMRKMTKSDFGDRKADKSSEINSSMSIKPTSPDQYTRKIKNIGGSN